MTATATVTVNKEGLDFTSPLAMSTTYVTNSSDGYAVFATHTQTWKGINLGYSKDYLMPISGIITDVTTTKPNSELIYTVHGYYQIKSTDVSLNSDNLAVTLMAQDNVQWYGGKDNDKFYFLGNNDSIDGGAGTDSLYTFHEFSAYKFSNLNTQTSSVTVTNVSFNIPINLTSIENFVFTDKTVTFADLAASLTNQPPTGNVIITGTVQQNQTLTASNTLADTNGLGAISYQWLSNGVVISGSNQTTYVLTQADVGKNISVSASYTDGLGKLESVTSTAQIVANVNEAPTGSVTVTGTPKQGQILTASNTLADPDGLGTISYQWLSNGNAINGANQATYTLTSGDAGKNISVKASYTDLQNTAESVTSTPTAIQSISHKYTLSVDTSDVNADGETLVSFSLSTDSPVDTDTTIPFKLSGTAKQSVNYDGLLTTSPAFVIPAGESTTDLSFTTKINSLPKATGTVVVTLSNPTDGGSILDNGQSVTIHNVFEGTEKADKWTGKATNDIAFGNGGNDTLSGSTGNDSLDGGAGNDKLIGGKGIDELTGGDGVDTFAFKKGESGNTIDTADTITDLTKGDKIDLSGISKSFNFIKTIATDINGSNLKLSSTKIDAYVANLDGENYFVYETTANGSSTATGHEIVAIGSDITPVNTWTLKAGILTV